MAFTQIVGIGICLEIMAAVIGTFSKQLIAFGEQRKVRAVSALGIAFNTVLGPITDASAYAFAPQTIIAPFAGLDVLFNAFTAPCTLRFQREMLTWRHILAAVMVAGGASSSAVLAARVEENETQTCDEFVDMLCQTRSIVYLSIELLLVLVTISSLWTGRISGTARGLALGGIAGLLMGNVFFVKGFVGFVKLAIKGDGNCFSQLTPYATLSAAAGGSILGTCFMQQGLRDYKGVYMVTLFEGAHISAACLSGDVVMWEMAHVQWPTWIGYWASILVIIGGILLINTTAKQSVQSDPEQIPHLSPIRSWGRMTGSDILDIVESSSGTSHFQKSLMETSSLHTKTVSMSG
mmetsp:Transcript_148494/g.262188  ORF Transcript_148494/g.262188 Transcript_148494/m.262188 type:complete len:350 (-) Transcript_148494:214-1263(-)